jgi:ABC-2 type transport system ATP-binding protein
MIVTKELSKRYKKTQALESASISIQRNQVVGIVGPNGSGKSTLLKIITGLITRHEGEVQFQGITGKNIAMASEEFGFPTHYSVRKVLTLFAYIKEAREQEVNEIAIKMGLQEHFHKSIKQLSQGLKQRLNIACALLGNPELIILDEPNNGLDPDGFKLLRAVIADLKNRGKTVVMASHLLNEVEKICDEVVFIKNGKVISQMHLGDVLKEHANLEDAYDFYASSLSA